MAHHSFWQYWGLKFRVMLIRLLNYLGTRRYLEPSPSCRRERIRIPSREQGRFIDAWIYYPREADETVSAPQPLLVNWHGSAFILPNLGMDHVFCDKIATEANMLVLDADYRKAPEYPFPGAVEDVEDTLRWVESQSARFDRERIAVSGFSAGATLALVAASQLRQNVPRLHIRAVYSFYPAVDMAMAPEDKIVPHPIRASPLWAQHLYTDSYLPHIEDRTSPKASPAFADVTAFSRVKVWLLVGSGDVFALEVDRFAKRLTEAGCDIDYYKSEGSAHGFDKAALKQSFREEEMAKTYGMVIKSLSIAM